MIVVQHTRFPSRIGNDILQNDDSFKGSVIQAKAQIIRLSGIGTEKRLCKYSIVRNISQQLFILPQSLWNTPKIISQRYGSKSAMHTGAWRFELWVFYGVGTLS